MTIGSTLAMTRAARAAGYAVPAVNIVDGFTMEGVVRGAEQRRSPIILQTSVKTVRSIGAAPLAALHRRLADTVSVPVALHLDHCPDRSVITLAIQHGWSSVLFDASDRDLATATHETREVVEEAHARGVAVESEIENIAGVEDGVGSDTEGALYDDGTLARFVADTGCDLFAPALGTAHGLYTTRPVLQPERARRLAVLLGVPIVLHGGSGLEKPEFRGFIEAGCAKVNISTSLKMAYLGALRAALEAANATGKWDPPTVFEQGCEAVASDVAAHVDIFGSADAAS